MTLLEDMERRGLIQVMTWGADRSLIPADADSRRTNILAYEAALFPNLDVVDGSIDYLLPDAPGLHFVITDEGKAEYLRREGPTADEDAWKAEGPNGSLSVWAKTEEIAERVAIELLMGKREVEQRTAMRCTFELGTGEQVNGVRVIFRLGPPVSWGEA